MATAVLMSSPVPTDDKWVANYISWPRHIQKRNYQAFTKFYNTYMIDF